MLGEPALEEWICGRDQDTLVNWINGNNQEKIQKYLSYNWNNPSYRVKQYITNLLSEKINNPIYAICTTGDPSNGNLLRIFLNFMDSIDLDYFGDQQSFLSKAVAEEELTIEQLRMLLTHPKAFDPFTQNREDAAFYFRLNECPIEIAIRRDNLEYVKEMLAQSKNPRIEKALKLACKSNLRIVEYLLDDCGLSVNEIGCGRTPLQHALSLNSEEKPTVDFLISRGADINGKDVHGNPVIFYALAYNHNNTLKLINKELDMRARTNKMRQYTTNLMDGLSVFRLAVMYRQYKVLQQLLEVKSTLPSDPDLEREVIVDVLLHGDFIAIYTMWPYVTTRDIIAVLITERDFELNYGEKIKPIEKLFRDYQYLQEEFNMRSIKWDLVKEESKIRSLLRHLLQNFSREEVDMIFYTETRNGEKLKYYIERQNLLPEDYRMSTQLWRYEVDFELGTLSNLPREIIGLIFSFLTFSDTCQVVSVSKSWFKEITATRHLIAHPKADPSSSNPFRSLQSIMRAYIYDADLLSASAKLCALMTVKVC
eukprot:TRINITY_DN8618_c0_g1_i1.p1 TRINITY_DN8618_c0_g1~~TRINITY_DN8618_c0_g1_i1.p1  ORF type:complete len:538 (+),score=47.46 TRINITY_DN8618_c0_g1_i1:36-1649(+)